jgi:hypothetical protein
MIFRASVGWCVLAQQFPEKRLLVATVPLLVLLLLLTGTFVLVAWLVKTRNRSVRARQDQARALADIADNLERAE